MGPESGMVDRKSSGEELESRERCDTLRGIRCQDSIPFEALGGVRGLASS